jgi:hypothetical protein
MDERVPQLLLILGDEYNGTISHAAVIGNSHMDVNLPAGASLKSDPVSSWQGI